VNNESPVTSLRADIARWKEMRPNASGTLMQGMAAKCAKQFEGLIRQLADQRVRAHRLDIEALLTEIHYRGDAREVRMLPLGTVTDLILTLRRYDSELSNALPASVAEMLALIPSVRNRTIHEMHMDDIQTRARSNGRPVATIKTAATVKAPPPITHHLRLAATGTAGGTLSSSTVRPTGGALAGSGE